ncbi:MAG: HU family DNA-binding protein [Paludibacteraceae bacterium]|nr:HU family DNA-binding protein [Paludibacteraceae bacterium]
MNNKGLIAELSKRLGVTQKQASDMLDASTAAIVDSMKEDTSLMLHGFGSFEVRKKSERVIINPSSGLQMNVPPKLTLVFKPSEKCKLLITNC